MITKKKQFWNSVLLVVFVLTTSLFLFITCLTVDNDLVKTEVAFSHDGKIKFEKVTGSKTFELKCNKDWRVTKGADSNWIAINPMSGLKGTVQITVDVKANDGEARESSFTITASSIEKTITITQEGLDAKVIDYISIMEIRKLYANKGQEEWRVAESLQLKGVVISDKDGGNSPAKRDGFIQDKAGNGIAFRVAQSSHSFDMGDELNINLEDATLLYYNGDLQLNFSSKAANVLLKNVMVTPKELTIEEILDGNNDGTLVKIKDVQFKIYKDLNYYDKGLATNRTLQSCNDSNIIVRTTKYATFKNKTLPAGKGDIVGIVSIDDGQWQFVIRNLDDVKDMSNDESTRCPKAEPPVVESKISIAEFRAAMVDGETYKGNCYLEGEVILNSYKSNVPDHLVYIADKTAGVALSFSDKENILTNVPIGAKVKVHVKNTKSKILNGLLQIGDVNSLATQAVDIVEKIALAPIEPKIVTLDEVLAGECQSELVKIENVQFKETNLKYADNPFVINKGKQEVQVFTRRDATFSNTAVKQGNGPVVAVASIYNSPQLLIRTVDDLVNMTGNRIVDAYIIVGENLIAYDYTGSSKTIKISANIDWTVSSDKPWLIITPKSGENNGEITATATENRGEERQAVITISDGVIITTVLVTQKTKTTKYIAINDVHTMFAAKKQETWTITEPLQLKGVVTSDRAGGNSRSPRNGFIQNGVGDGLAFCVVEFTHMFDMGNELNINLEGATVSKYEGALQISFSTNKVKVETKNVTITPRELTIEEVLKGTYDGTLVKIKELQFKTYKDLNYYEGIGNATSRIMENCNGANIILHTSKYSSFKDKALPAGKGDIVGIVSQNYGTRQLSIRNLNDVKEMNNEETSRCHYVPPIKETKISIADFRATISDGETYTRANYIEGQIILNSYKGNVPDNTVYIADKTAGLVLTFSDKENILTNVPIGAKVKVHVKDVKAKVLYGLLQIGYNNTLATQDVDIVEKTTSTPLQPRVVSMNDVLAGKYQSELVKIESVQFKDINAKYIDNPFIINEAKQEVIVYTKKEASFANEFVKQGMGSIVSILSIQNSPQLLIVSVEDLAAMVGNRFGATPSYIDIDKTSVIFEQEGGEETINISSNVNWKVKSDQSWLKFSTNSGSNDGWIIVSALKNNDEERRATISITDGTITKTFLAVQEGKPVNEGLATDLFFSEYVEGTSNNKYLEIYNGTGATVDLSDYRIELYVNGQSTAKLTEILTGTLENGKVKVYKHSKAAIYDGEATASTAISFNGNDAIALVKISTDAYVDIFGCIGFDPGKEWIENSPPFSLTTKDKTLVRRPSVKRGLTINPVASFPALDSEWISYPVDTVDYLGSHTMN